MGEAIPNTQNVVTIEKYVVDAFTVDSSAVSIRIKIVLSNGKMRFKGIQYRTQQDVLDFITALMTPLGDEAGGALRRANYRILTFLASKLDLEDVTVNP